MKLNRCSIAAAASIAIMLSGSAVMFAQGQSGNASSADRMFVKKAMEGGMAEVQMGQLAAQKASSDDVKQFGQKMVHDHTELNDQMKPIAAQLGITPPASLSAMDMAEQKKLEALSGEAFDKAYIRDMVKDHRKDLAEFRQEASTGQSPEVKQAATHGEQVIQEHLQLAQGLAQKLGVSSGAKSSTMSGDAH